MSGAPLKVIQESSHHYSADACFGQGYVQIGRLLSVLLDKAASNAVVSGTLCRCGHVGRLGEWVEKVAAAGYAGMLSVNDNGASYFVAPPGGKEPRTSTNPIAFSIPLQEDDVFLLDMSTSATAMGKIYLAYLSEEKVQNHLLQDADGRPTNDPSVLFEAPKGALLPMGCDHAYKGFGLSMVVDLLTAGLSGGYAPPGEGGELFNNVFLTIWNPAYFSGFSHMSKQARGYIDFLRKTKPIDPDQPVRLPGDRSAQIQEIRERQGLALSENVCGKLVEMAQKLDVAVPEFLTLPLQHAHHS